MTKRGWEQPGQSSTVLWCDVESCYQETLDSQSKKRTGQWVCSQCPKPMQQEVEIWFCWTYSEIFVYKTESKPLLKDHSGSLQLGSHFLAVALISITTTALTKITSEDFWSFLPLSWIAAWTCAYYDIITEWNDCKLRSHLPYIVQTATLNSQINKNKEQQNSACYLCFWAGSIGKSWQLWCYFPQGKLNYRTVNKMMVNWLQKHSLW